ncbi:MAG TPA: hypothetical protein VJ398_01150 [Acidimicrobiia bacterium]|nr:hypothetical protein [Acidimicrobiia bacterium]
MNEDINASAVPTQSSIDWTDIVATIVMAVAALLTAWSAFQSDQWSDNMSFSFSGAAAARTESTRNSTRAGQLAQIDVSTFIAWMEAAQREVAAGEIDVSDGYHPDPATLSGFLYARFRPEFRAAMDPWLATRPFINPDAPPTPFAMPEYKIAEADEAERLQQVADDKAAQAQAADRNDDKYVMSTIIFAAVFLFAGLSTKMRSRAGQLLMLGFAIVFLLGGAVFVLTVPIQV